jgi:type III secretion system YopN/LcrE/InvE/MxiC family regulator
MPEIETLRQSIAQMNVISPVGAEIMDQVRGQHDNETVMRSDESSKLTEASEELGMSVAHRADKKTLGDRQVRQGQGTNFEAVTRLSEYLNNLPNMPREAELKSLVDKLKQFEDLLERGGDGTGAMPTKEDILALLQEFDGDVTHQFAALEIAREYFETEGASPEFHALLDEARAEFEREDVARDVRAGFAIAQIAARAAETLETDPASVRETYREMLRQNQNMGQLFDSLSKYDLQKNFEEVIDMFMMAAGRDLSSTGPSTDDQYLHALITELGKLKKLQTVFESTEDLIKTSKPMFKPNELDKLDTVGVTSRLLNFVSKPVVNIGDARGLLTGLDQSAPSSRLVFMNGLQNLHRELHDEIMPSPQARQQQSTTIDLLLQELVAFEEIEYQKSMQTEQQTSRPS